MNGWSRGTPFYISPDAWRGNVSKSSDIWAVGVIVYYILLSRRTIQKYPFGVQIEPCDAMTPSGRETIKADVLECETNPEQYIACFQSTEWKNLSPKCKNFIKRCWDTKNPSTATDLLSDPWIENHQQQIRRKQERGRYRICREQRAMEQFNQFKKKLNDVEDTMEDEFKKKLNDILKKCTNQDDLAWRIAQEKQQKIKSFNKWINDALGRLEYIPTTWNKMVDQEYFEGCLQRLEKECNEKYKNANRKKQADCNRYLHPPAHEHPEPQPVKQNLCDWIMNGIRSGFGLLK